MSALDSGAGGRVRLDSVLRASIGAWLVLGLAQLVLGRPVAAAFHLAVVSATAGSGWLARRRPDAWRFSAHAAAAAAALGLLGAVVSSGGLGAGVWWHVGLIPLFVALVLDARATLVWTTALAAGVTTVALVPGALAPSPPTVLEHALAGSLFLLGAAAFVLAARRHGAEPSDPEAAPGEAPEEQPLALMVARRSLQEASDRVEAVSRDKADLLATLSAELRAPLDAILGVGAVLLESQLERPQRELVATLVASAEAQRRLLDDVSELARLEAGRLQLAPDAFAVRDCIEDVADLFSGQASEKKLELTVVLDDSLPAVVRSDGLRVRQIVTSLLGHAVTLTDAGSVIVRARALDGDPTAGGRTTLEIAVEDTGAGLGAAQIGVWFRQPAQADASSAGELGGPGIGLAISRHLAWAMGGDLEVESEPGRGSRFVLRWPADVIERGAPSTAWAGSSVLLLEASAVAGAAFSGLVRTIGARAAVVSCVQGVEEAVQRTAPVCVIVGTPQTGDAPSVARQLRARLGFACPPLVAAVAASHLATARGWVSAGVFDASTLKPFRRARLTAVLDDLAGRMVSGPTSRPPLSSSVVRALVVDDDDTGRKVARLLLARHGWDVTEAASGHDALAALAGARFDVAFVDLHMPRMDGAQLASRIAATLVPEDVPILVALTASVLPDEHARAKQAGMHELVQKPIDLDVLAALVARLQPRARAPGAGRHAFASTLPPAGRKTAAKLLPVPVLDLPRSARPVVEV